MWESIVLGLVQGLTEFLPVSSSAHLRIVGELMGSSDPGAGFTAITQIGTEAAVVLYFRRDIARICVAWWRAVSGARGSSLAARLGGPVDGTPADHEALMAWFIALGSVPIVLLGLVFQDSIESTFRDLRLVALMLIVFGLVLGWADRVGRSTKEVTDLDGRDAVLFGVAQAMALVPGVSRSGGTISMGRFLGYTREAAARYSFLLALPAVLGSGFFQLAKSLSDDPAPGSASGAGTLVATVIAFVVGYFVIIAFLKIVSTFSYRGFVVYRIVVALIVFLLLAIGTLHAVPTA